jgi:hypothetical protein
MQLLPFVATAVVDTESFCAGRNLKGFTRQSAQAGDAEQSIANAMVGIVARIEVPPFSGPS